MKSSLSLGELRDLEVALQAGHGPEAWPQTGDQTRLARSRTQLLRDWLRAVYQHTSRPGLRLERSLSLLAWSLMGGGALLGVSATKYALRYDGSEPVNVITFLAYLVLPQIVWLGLAGMMLVVRRCFVRSLAIETRGVIPRLMLAWIEQRVLSKTTASVGAVDLRPLYQPVVGWHVFTLMQIFGIAFNVAALSTALGLVTFTDLAFAWSTSLRVDAAEVHRAASQLGRPFPALVPTAEVVSATRYYRLDARYAGGGADRRAADIAATTAWWPFLAASLVVYGLLPRIVLVLFCYGGYRLRLRRVPLNAFEIDRLVRGIIDHQHRRSHEVSRLEPDRALHAAIPNDSERLLAKASAATRAGTAIIWRDAPWADTVVQEIVARHSGVAPTLIFRAEEDFDGRQTAANLPTQGTIYVLVDGFATLQKALIRFLVGLRQQVAAQRLIVILPVYESDGRLVLPPNESQRLYWRKAAQALGDPFLGAYVGEQNP